MRRKIIIYISCIIIFIKIIIFIYTIVTPYKYAIKLSEIANYKDSILIKQTWHTGTGWEIVGNNKGLYNDKMCIEDIKITGNIPPLNGLDTERSNIFLCEIVSNGEFQIPGTNSDVHLYKEYVVVNWYPIYPIERNCFLENLLYSKKFFSIHDFNSLEKKR